ncbi:preprotein translocase subunit SecY [Buchnera aphidicola]|uniref:preprotein translocase subunit SecY n=1 Tax=Buchnera aphidicola TaxID=9 RepID=UPI0030EE5B40
MLKKLPNYFKNSFNSNYLEIKNRLSFLIFALIIFRIGSFIPIPSIHSTIIVKILKNSHSTIMDIFNMFSGGALRRVSIFSLGIMPYISASIIIQLLTFLYKPLIELKKEGEFGRLTINNYTKNFTLILAIIQSIIIAISLPYFYDDDSILCSKGINYYFYITTSLSLVTGTMFLMWLGDLITERGLGNGISIIIFSGIVASLPEACLHTIKNVKSSNLSYFNLLEIFILVFFVIFFVVFIERAQRKILIYYSNKNNNRRLNTIQSSYLPLKINMSGVIPAIFSASLVLFPATISSWIIHKNLFNFLFLIKISQCIQPGQPIYIILYILSIIFFCFFYTNLTFNPRETAENLKKSGAFIAGIRPGEQTSIYIENIMLKLISINSMYIVFICLVPDFMRNIIHAPFYFGGTSLLIVVVVIIDFISQIQTLMMSNRYNSIFKKSNLSF